MITARTTKPRSWNNRWHVGALIGPILLASALQANAATAICQGKITSLASHAPGGLYVTIEGTSFSGLKVCDFDSTQFSISAANCKHIASLATLAFAMGKQVQ